MKRLKTQVSRAKKQKRNQLIIGIVLVGVMMLSVFGIVANSFGDDSEEEPLIFYNGLEFFKQGSYWYAQIEDFNFIFSNNPNDLNGSYLKFNNSLKLLNNYINKPLYLYSDEPTLNNFINQNLSPFVERMQFACYEEENCPENYPIKECDENFILIIEEEVPSLEQNGNCVFIKGSYDDLPKVIDEFVLRILGVKNSL